MKLLLAICLTLTVACSYAADKPAAPPMGAVVKGTVLEVKDVPSYTYLRLKTKDGEIWAATSTTPIKIGAEVTLENTNVMNNFESKALHKTFPTIVFGTLAGAQASGSGMGNPHAGMAKPVDVGDVHVPKATGANARTIAEVVTKSGELKDKPVVVRGKVVKYNPEIMGKNWVHLRDGSGSAADNSNDILVTTAGQTKVGDVVLVEGIVRTDKDFGSGYAYKVMIEDAKLKK
jgi:hypothetical protein